MVPQTLKRMGDTGGYLRLIDQRKLPAQFVHLDCNVVEKLYEAIQTLAVRGAPAIGVSAAYGICLAMQTTPDDGGLSEALLHLENRAEYLATSRPTAVNLFWALDRMKACAKEFIAEHTRAPLEQLKERLLTEAHAICREDQQMCKAIGKHGQSLIPSGGAVLTHCNAGALATAGQGTALSPMYEAHAAGKQFKVYADETRPLLQGARLTAWELQQVGIDVTVICDNMAGALMKAGKIDAVIVGADRIAANGDAANKIGTFTLSILAKEHEIPFYVAAPSSTFDRSLESGDRIPIEQRKAEEVTAFAGKPTAPKDIHVYNPAFDVTPADNITAIITERGMIEKPNRDKITRHLE